jgi:hypothetical protein
MCMNRHDESDSAWCASADIGSRAASRRKRAVGPLLVAGLCLASGVAEADVPTIEDIAACNREARGGFRSRSVAPTSKDEAGADTARQARGGTVSLPDATGDITQSADPQIHGMDGEGAKNAAYRAVYRVCMRRKGF